MWIYLLILIGSWLYRWYRRKNSFIVDGHNRSFLKHIFELIQQKSDVNVEIRKNQENFLTDYVPMDPIIFTLPSVRFSVRFLKSSEILEDRMGPLTDRFTYTYDLPTRNGMRLGAITYVGERQLFQVDILSNPISYSELYILLCKETNRLVSSDTGFNDFVILYQFRYRNISPALNLFTRRLKSASIPFFHPCMDLITSTSSYLLFHGPSGNGKSLAASWLTQRLKIQSKTITSDIHPQSILNRLENDLTRYGIIKHIYVFDHLDQFIQNPEWISGILQILRWISFYPNVLLIATVRDLSTLNGTGLVGPSKFKPIPFDYPNAKVMNQITQHYYQRDYTGEIPKSIPIDTIMEYARTKSYEEFTTMF